MKARAGITHPVSLLLVGLFVVVAANDDERIRMDSYLQDLMSKMTVQEKIGQLNLVTPGGGVPTGSAVSHDVEGTFMI